MITASRSRWGGLAMGLLLVATDCRPKSSEPRAAALSLESDPGANTAREVLFERQRRWLKLPGEAAVARLVSPEPESEAGWYGVSLGDGWGCALRQDRSYECWVAHASDDTSRELRARSMPWLDGKRIFVGPDRLCVFESADLHCWRAPDLFRDPARALGMAPGGTESWTVNYSEPRPWRDAMPVTHGLVLGCMFGYCWGASSPLALPACQLGSLGLPCAVADGPGFRELAGTVEAGRTFLAPSLQPSACSIDDRHTLQCSGARYSPEGSAAAVRVRPGEPHVAAAWDAPGKFYKECAIHTNCARSLRTLPKCAPSTKSFTPPELLAQSGFLEGARVAVRGNLELSPVAWHGLSGIGCGVAKDGKPIFGTESGVDQYCCPAQGDAPVLVSTGGAQILLGGSWCFGDSSRTCCSLPVFGQPVIASGTLFWREAGPESNEGWVLQNPEVCEQDPEIRSAP